MRSLVDSHVRRIEALGISHLLIAQRWWGNGDEIEGSSLDCLTMTSHIAAVTSRLKLITAVHPGFFSPAVIAKWAASLDALHPGRWSVNVTSGWNLQEFSMYGVDPLAHDTRYQRAIEFIRILKGAWDSATASEPWSHQGQWWSVDGLVMEPRPQGGLEIFQGGQSNSARDMAAGHADWMFLNGGRPEKLEGIIRDVRERAQRVGRNVRFAVYAAPLCRPTDSAAWSEIDSMLARLDAALVEKRKARVSGASGMWADEDDPLTHLDTNEGYCTRLIGSPETIFANIKHLKSIGIDLLHLDLRDSLFIEAVLPTVHAL